MPGCKDLAQMLVLFTLETTVFTMIQRPAGVTSQFFKFVCIPNHSSILTLVQELNQKRLHRI